MCFQAHIIYLTGNHRRSQQCQPVPSPRRSVRPQENYKKKGPNPPGPQGGGSTAVSFDLYCLFHQILGVDFFQFTQALFNFFYVKFLNIAENF